jgi:hypothetical protein
MGTWFRSDIPGKGVDSGRKRAFVEANVSSIDDRVS